MRIVKRVGERFKFAMDRVQDDVSIYIQIKSIGLARTMDFTRRTMNRPFNYLHFLKTQFVYVLIHMHSFYMLKLLSNALFSALNLKESLGKHLQ